MMVWKEEPSEEQAEAELSAFFAALISGQTDAAKAMLQHTLDDWDMGLWALWLGSYVAAQEAAGTPVADTSMETGNWNDDAWLAKLTVGEPSWDDDWVTYPLAYGEITGEAEFRVTELDDETGFVLERLALAMG